MHLTTATIDAQQVRWPSGGRVAFQRDERWGFVDEHGEEVIACAYDDVGDFCTGFACVEREGSWGYLNAGGRLIIPCRFNQGRLYDRNWDFSLGRAVVRGVNGAGVITLGGQVVAPLAYERIGRFSEGLAVVQKAGCDRFGYIDRSGAEVIARGSVGHFSVASLLDRGRFSFRDGRALALDDDLARGFITHDGTWIAGRHYPMAWPFSEGRAAVAEVVSHAADAHDEALYRVGYIDRRGEEIIRPAYGQAYPFRDGRARVNRDHRNTTDGTGRYGFIDPSGTTVVPCAYARAEDFSEGMAAVCRRDSAGAERWGFVDLTGRLAIPCTWAGVRSFANGLAVVHDEEFHYGLIDRTGAIILRPTRGYLYSGDTPLWTKEIEEGSTYALIRAED